MAKPKLIKRVLRTEFNKDNPLPENLLFLKNLRPHYHAITTYQEDGKAMTVVEYPVRRAAIIADKLRSDDVENFDERTPRYNSPVGSAPPTAKLIKNIFEKLNNCYEAIPTAARKIKSRNRRGGIGPDGIDPSSEYIDEIKKDPLKFIEYIQNCIVNLAKIERRYDRLLDDHVTLAEQHGASTDEYEATIKAATEKHKADINEYQSMIKEHKDANKILKDSIKDHEASNRRSEVLIASYKKDKKMSLDDLHHIIAAQAERIKRLESNVIS